MPPQNTTGYFSLKVDMQSNNKHKLQAVRNLTESTYVLELERKGMEFEAGQHILLGDSVPL